MRKLGGNSINNRRKNFLGLVSNSKKKTKRNIVKIEIK